MAASVRLFGSLLLHRKARFLALVLAPLLICSACSSSRSTLGDDPIPEQHLRMNEYAPDTNASAVILRDEGDVRVEKKGNIIYERFRRVKLLSQDGYDYAEVRIPYYTGENGQRISQIRGHTITTDLDSGGLEFHALKDESIFREDVEGNRKQVRFTLPALEPGAIVEYRYKMTSRSPLFLPDWQF